MDDGLHRTLRQATTHSHRLLDHHPLMMPLLRPNLSVGQYGDAPLETGILSSLQRLGSDFDYADRLKSLALLGDLESLGRAARPASMSFPAASTWPELVGILYVVEGASMGGQHILRHLRKTGMDLLPTRYFSGYGDDNDLKWQYFWSIAEGTVQAPEYQVTAAMAVTLFRAIGAHFDGLAE